MIVSWAIPFWAFMDPGRPVGPPSRVVARITRLPVRSSCVASATGRPAASSTNKYLAPVARGEPGKKPW